MHEEGATCVDVALRAAMESIAAANDSEVVALTEIRDWLRPDRLAIAAVWKDGRVP